MKKGKSRQKDEVLLHFSYWIGQIKRWLYSLKDFGVTEKSGVLIL